MELKTLSRGEQTRLRVLDAAEQLVLRRGFAATSIDEIIGEAGITKSGFLYHFRDKNELAKGLLIRYLAKDEEILNEVMEKAFDLNDDPLHGFLIALKLFADVMDNVAERHPGCIVASYCYQDQIFSREIRELSRAGILTWRNRFRRRFDLIAAKYPPKRPVDLDAMADMVITLIEGGIVLDKAARETRMLSRQIMLFRTFVRMTFDPS